MENKCVSVIIPMYNAEKTIEKTLDSVRNQTKFDKILEVIVVDDGSTDLSPRIVDNYRHNNKNFPLVYFRQDNQGVSVARNKGLKESKGEYIALLDSDDIWYPNKIERQLQVFLDNPKIVFLGVAYKDEPFKRFGKTITTLYNAKIEDVLWSYFPVTPSVMFKRKALDVVGYFDEKMMYCEDINYYLRFLVNFNYYYLPERLVEIDCGKKYSKEAGLSSNLWLMHKGEMQNLYSVYKKRCINIIELFIFFVFTELKFIRRIIITRIKYMVGRKNSKDSIG